MVTIADFTVPGIAKSESKKQRPLRLPDGRLVSVGPRTDDKPQAEYKARVALFARQAIPAPVSGPVALRLHITRPQPRSYPRKPTPKYPWPWADMAKRKDLDNVAKLLCDALTGVAYHDDCQIVDLHVSRSFGEHGVRIVLSVALHGERAAQLEEAG